MKKILTLTLSALPIALWAQITDVSKAKDFREIEHEIPGCPINSICDEERGKLIAEFESILKTEDSKKRFEKLNYYSKTNGLPLKVLTSKEAGLKNHVVMWNSRCKNHNPKNPNDTTYQGYLITKNIPLKTDLHFDKVHLFTKEGIKTYTVPYQDKPLFIKGDRLHFLKDYDDQLYKLSLDNKGSFKLENLDSSVYAKAQSKKVKEVPCPENQQSKSDLHSETYCQKIWDIDTNELKTVQVFWSCP